MRFQFLIVLLQKIIIINKWEDINMARPIKETPILYGKAARKFEEEMQRVENMTREERMANRKKVEEGCSAFLKTVKVCI